MRKIRLFLISMGLAIFGTTMSAQTLPWTGANPETLATTGEEFYLYNVGTGKFVCAGGDHGTQAVMLFQDYGIPMTLAKTESGKICLKTNFKYTDKGNTIDGYFGVNYPNKTTKNGRGSENLATSSYTVILQARTNGEAKYISGEKGVGSIILDRTRSYNRSMTFESVNSSSTTYRIKENINLPKVDRTWPAEDFEEENYDFYIGAKNGIDATIEPTEENNQKVYTYKDYDNEVAFANTLENVSVVDDCYKWIFVPKSELIEKMQKADPNVAGGLNINATFLLKDPMFDRDNLAFSDWTVTGGTLTAIGNSGESQSGINNKTNGKYAYGYLDKGGAQQSFQAPVTGNYEIEFVAFGTAAQGFAFEQGKIQKTVDLASASFDTQLATGESLYNNAANVYTRSIIVNAEAGNNIIVGFSGTNVSVKRIQVRYLGPSDPFVLDQDMESADYITNADNYTTTVYLKRNFTLGKWNTLVLPVSLTAEQIKQAFGEGTEVAELTSDGKFAINFVTTNTIESGKLYIVKPVNDAHDYTLNTQEGEAQTIKAYQLGVRAVGDNNWAKDPVDDSQGNLIAQGTYSKSTAPAKAYAFSNGQVYHLTNAQTIKGFRGWITTADGSALSIKYNGDEITSIDGVKADGGKNISSDIYSIEGVLVKKNATSLEGLPAGIYIFNGKKHVVK